MYFQACSKLCIEHPAFILFFIKLPVFVDIAIIYYRNKMVFTVKMKLFQRFELSEIICLLICQTYNACIPILFNAFVLSLFAMNCVFFINTLHKIWS